MTSVKHRQRALCVLRDEIVACTACPRLVTYLKEVARKGKREFAGQTYWARPVPGFGDPDARLLLVGLAPAAHGGARTGRAFTGDSSGRFLMRALHKQGFASVPRSDHKEDGLELRRAWIGIAARCAPPDNKPLPRELDRCRPYLVRELALLERVRVVVALGKIAWDSLLRAAREAGWTGERVGFSHGSRLRMARPDGVAVTVLGSYHPSRQNTNTGRLTEAMFDDVFRQAAQLANDE
jgi:uracil-DNA glycosylase family 4